MVFNSAFKGLREIDKTREGVTKMENNL